jgi:preprotein translocase subunit SecA
MQVADYFERETPEESRADLIWQRLPGRGQSLLAPWLQNQNRKIAPAVAQSARDHHLSDLTEEAFDQQITQVALALRRCDSIPRALAAQSFALIREQSGRLFGMWHHDVQLRGGWALLQGQLAEMNTGEGKTLTATLAAITAALSGKPVHVVTVNDYLAQRDRAKMIALYERFGLSVGLIVEGLSPEDRRAAYGCDVTYCSNNELAFDYLKDRLVLNEMGKPLRRSLATLAQVQQGRLIMRGLHYAIVDEADSILIDEARTALILSQESEDARGALDLETALEIAQGLKDGVDFRISADGAPKLSQSGQARLAQEGHARGGLWASVAQREFIIERALTALHRMQPGVHYLVHEGQVQIVDESTGRLMPDRFWSNGLHQLVELKEGLVPSAVKVTLAKMSYQRFFRRYAQFAGMTGTAGEVAAELWEVYRLKTIGIPPHRPRRLVQHRPRIFDTNAQKLAAVTKLVADQNRAGIPVLIGTRTVEASKLISAALTKAQLPHAVLNAEDEAAEGGIVARAGQRGQITVATNMAGRGTDIELGPDVEDLGGLTVIMTEMHDSARIDRQLAGRAARQGDPGAFYALMCLEDEIAQNAPVAYRWLLRLCVSGRWHGAAYRILRQLQHRQERAHKRLRRAMLRHDSTTQKTLAFSGRE